MIRTRRQNAVVVVVLSCVAILVMLFAAGLLTSGHKPPEVSPPPAAAHPVYTPPATAAKPPATTAQRVTAWYAASGAREIRALAAQLAAVDAATSGGNLTASAAACGKMRNVVAGDQSAPPIPDAIAQHWWAAALAEYSTGATQCQAGITSGDFALVKEATAHIGVGNADLSKAIARLDAIRS